MTVDVSIIKEYQISLDNKHQKHKTKFNKHRKKKGIRQKHLQTDEIFVKVSMSP